MISLDIIKEWYVNGKPSAWIDPPYFEYMPKFPLTLFKIKERPEIKKVIDIGCHTGYFIRGLSKKGYECVGIDIQKQLMELMQAEVSSDKERGLKFYFLPVERLSEKFNQEFDAAVLLDVLEHCLDDKRAIEETEKALKPGGWIFINLPRDWEYSEVSEEHIRSYTDDYIKDLFGSKKNYQFELCKDEFGRNTSYITYQT